MRVEVNPGMLQWAWERAGVAPETLLARFPRLFEWGQGISQPTLRQLEDFARATRAPVGVFFLPEPPVEAIPIPDYRTSNGAPRRPSPDLLDTIYLSRQRQEWYVDYARMNGEKALPFVGSVSIDDSVESVAQTIRQMLGLGGVDRARYQNWEEALRRLVEKIEDLGVLVMTNGVVGNNTHRKLDPQEFRGFALVDDVAPLIFVNGADAKAAQMFTLAHELAHIWLGESGLSDVGTSGSSHKIERWCDQVAAEVLVPAQAMVREFREEEDLRGEVQRLSGFFRVSVLVILRRLRDTGLIDGRSFEIEYGGEVRLHHERQRGGGGDFYATEFVRVGKRFARAIVANTLEGRTSYKDAFRLLGFSKVETLKGMARELGIG